MVLHFASFSKWEFLDSEMTFFFAHESEFAVTQPFYIIVVQGRSRFAGKQRMKGFLRHIT